MKEGRSPPSFFKQKITLAIFICSLVVVSFVLVVPLQQAHAFTPTQNPLIKVGTDASGPGTLASQTNYGETPFNKFSCYMNGIWWVYWLSTNADGKHFSYSYSSDGVTWTASATLFIATNVVSGGWGASCNAATAPNIILVYAASVAGTQTDLYNKINVATPNAPTNGPDVAFTGFPAALANTPIQMSLDGFGSFIVQNQAQAGTVLYLSINGAYSSTITPAHALGGAVSGLAGISADGSGGASPQNQVMWATNGNNYVPALFYAGNEYDFTVPTSTKNGIGQGVVSAPTGKDALVIIPYGEGASNAAANCKLAAFDIITRTYLDATPASLTGQGCADLNGAQGNTMWCVSDAGLNVWCAFYGLSAILKLTYSSDGGQTWTTVGFSNVLGTATMQPLSFIGINGLGQALMVGVDTSNNIYVTMFGSTGSTLPATPQTQTAGQCPTKNTGTFNPVNNTVYYYSQTAVGFTEAVSSVSSFLASTSAPATPQNLILAIYVSTGSGAISIANPLNLVAQHTFSITAGTKNQALNFAAATPLFTAGQTFAVALLGTNKLSVNDSTLAGLQSAVTSGGNMPTTITTNTASGVEPYLCGTANYQSIFTTTATSTTTVGGTATTTTTTTITTLDSTKAVTGSANYAIVLLLLLIPAMLLAGGLAYSTHSPLAAMLGFVVGLTIGAGVGNQVAGIIPPQIFGMVIFLDVVIVTLSMIFLRGQ